MGRRRRDLVVLQLGAELDRLPLDRAVGKDRDGEHDARREPDELHAADRGLLERRPDDDGGVIGQAGEQLAGVAQHLLERAVRMSEERAHLLGPK